tara:strand:+ start:132 stop:764 length:633 start_codon:yes stop_codon:yes gene_type:complete
MGFKGLSYIRIDECEDLLKKLEKFIQDMKTSKKTYKGYVFVLEYILNELQKSPVIFINYDGQEIESILTFIKNNLNIIIDEKKKTTLKDSLKNEIVRFTQLFKNTYFINNDNITIQSYMKYILPYVIAIKSITLFMSDGLNLPFEPSHKYNSNDFEYILYYLYTNLYNLTQYYLDDTKENNEWGNYDFLNWLRKHHICHHVKFIHLDLHS